MLKISNLTGFGAGVVGIPAADSLLLESGDFLLLEDGFKLRLDNTGDEFFSSVGLFLPFNETDTATETSDLSNSAHVMTFQAGAEIDDAQSLWGNSLLLDGTSTGQITALDHADWSFGSSPFTVEAWVRFSAAASNSGTIISQYNFNGNQRSWALFISATGMGLLYSFNGSSTASVSQSGITVSNDTWYHFAITRDSSHDIRLFFEGLLIKTQNIGASGFKASSSTLSIGNRASGSEQLGSSGDSWVEDLRITNGIARYTTSFTPSGPNRHPNE